MNIPSKLTLFSALASGCLLNPMLGQAPDNAGPPQNGVGVGSEIRESVQNLRSDLGSLRTDLRESRNAMLEGLQSETTPEERRQAISEWQAANADKIAEVQQLSQEIRSTIMENRPERPEVADRPDRPERPEAIVESRRELQAHQREIAQSRAEAIRGLTDPEEIRTVIDQWREDQSERIAEMRELNNEVSAWAQSNRPERPERPENADMEQLRPAIAENAENMRGARNDLAESMRGPMDPEERKAVIDAFRQEQKELMEEHKELRREQRMANNQGQAGSRRPGN